jgi:hypothetical protein
MKKLAARPVDRLIEAYVGWREACLVVEDAYRSWCRTARVGAASAFQRYCAALDTEEHAAEVYARMLDRVDGRPATHAQTFPGMAA